MDNDKYLSKLAGLLRLAETTKNDAEAATYMAAAQKLAKSHSLSLDVARSYVKDKEKRESPTQKHITLGARGKKGLKHYVNLFLKIAAVNDVQCNIAHNSTYVNAFGFPSDIEATEALYASLVLQMVAASDEFLRSGEYKKETTEAPVYGESYYDSWMGRTIRDVVGYTDKPVDGRVARANFQESFISRIYFRLRMAATEAIHDADVDAGTLAPEDSTESSGMELVLANKTLEVRDFYNEKSTAKGSWRGNRSSKGYSGSARIAGAAAGERARLGGEKAIGGSPLRISS